MKIKIIAAALSVLFLLSACSVQERVSADIFLERLAAEYESLPCETFAMGNETFCFLSSSDKKQEVLLIAACDENGNVYKITLISDSSNHADLIEKSQTAFSVYTLNVDFSEFFKSDYIIKSKTGFYDYETENYLLNFSCINGKESVSIQNIKLSVVKMNELTLKPNDKTYIENETKVRLR